MSDGIKFSETPEVPQESNEVTEAKQQLDRATIEPEAAVEKGAISQAETIQMAFTNSIPAAQESRVPPAVPEITTDLSLDRPAETGTNEESSPDAPAEDLESRDPPTADKADEGKPEPSPVVEENAEADKYGQKPDQEIKPAENTEDQTSPPSLLTTESNPEHRPSANEPRADQDQEAISEKSAAENLSVTKAESLDQSNTQHEYETGTDPDSLSPLYTARNQNLEDSAPEVANNTSSETMTSLFQQFRESIEGQPENSGVEDTSPGMDSSIYIGVAEGETAGINLVEDQVSELEPKIESSEWWGVSSGGMCPHSEEADQVNKSVKDIQDGLTPENLGRAEQLAETVWQEALPLKMNTNLEDLIENVVQSQTSDMRPDDRDQIVVVALAKTVQTVRETIHTILKNPGVEKWTALVDFSDQDLPEDDQYNAAFENFDQKAIQLLNMVRTVLKSTREMNSSVKRNIT